MSIALLLIPLALVLLAAAIGAFFWAVDHDQFEDLDTVARHALDEDPPPQSPQPEVAPAAGSAAAPAPATATGGATLPSGTRSP